MTGITAPVAARSSRPSPKQRLQGHPKSLLFYVDLALANYREPAPAMQLSRDRAARSGTNEGGKQRRSEVEASSPHCLDQRLR